MSDTPKLNAADAHETMEALLCEMQGLRDELEEAKRERDEARNLADSAMWEADRLRSKLEKLVCERDEARLQYSTTLVFCQSLVKERLEEMEGAE